MKNTGIYGNFDSPCGIGERLSLSPEILHRGNRGEGLMEKIEIIFQTVKIVLMIIGLAVAVRFIQDGCFILLGLFGFLPSHILRS